MSVHLAKTTDTYVYVTVHQRPDGSVTGVELSDEQPDRETVWDSNPRSTVWATPDNHQWEDDDVSATKVLDLAISNRYQFEDGAKWSAGERKQYAFHADTTEERAFLRTVESHLIRAGYLNGHTAMVGYQDHGLILDGHDEHFVRQDHTGWRFYTADHSSFQPEEASKTPIAPRNTSAGRLAAAILVQLANISDIDTGDLPLRHRIRVRYGLWRLTPNWKNFKYRVRTRIDRYRRRITVRIR
ncbi:hypothetical protein ACFVHW_04330 [Streptomyces sp. NPDC127110]|uniref:hypothetical protein n=1 Tax=Streptomyces sp. NPDC127110 TaxID=3345362 RepID=UPI003638893E